MRIMGALSCVYFVKRGGKAAVCVQASLQEYIFINIFKIFGRFEWLMLA